MASLFYILLSCYFLISLSKGYLVYHFPLCHHSHREASAPHSHVFQIWPNSHATVKATWTVYSAMTISVPQMCHALSSFVFILQACFITTSFTFAFHSTQVQFTDISSF